MKKWCLIENFGTDEYINAFDSKENALEYAEWDFRNMTAADKKHCKSYMVALVNVEQTGNIWSFAELLNGTIDCELYEIAKEFI